MDCGSGLLLAITSRMRRIDEGEVVLPHTRERSVLADLPAWARLAGHALIAVVDDAAATGPGPWRLWIKPGSSYTGAAARSVAADVEYTSGAPAPLEHIFDVVRDVVAVQAAAGSQGRAVFRCT